MVAGPYNPDAFNPAQRPDENMPDRGMLGWARDVAIDTVRGVGKIAAAVPAIAAMSGLLTSKVGPTPMKARRGSARRMSYCVV